MNSCPVNGAPCARAHALSHRFYFVGVMPFDDFVSLAINSFY